MTMRLVKMRRVAMRLLRVWPTLSSRSRYLLLLCLRLPCLARSLPQDLARGLAKLPCLALALPLHLAHSLAKLPRLALSLPLHLARGLAKLPCLARACWVVRLSQPRLAQTLQPCRVVRLLQPRLA